MPFNEAILKPLAQYIATRSRFKITSNNVILSPFWKCFKAKKQMKAKDLHDIEKRKKALFLKGE